MHAVFGDDENVAMLQESADTLMSVVSAACKLGPCAGTADNAYTSGTRQSLLDTSNPRCMPCATHARAHTRTQLEDLSSDSGPVAAFKDAFIGCHEIIHTIANVAIPPPGGQIVGGCVFGGSRGSGFRGGGQAGGQAGRQDWWNPRGLPTPHFPRTKQAPRS
jgi:hypothetical protein